MADGAQLLDALSAHLIAQGIARDPSAGGALPPLFLQPEGGAPGPGDKPAPEGHADLVMSAVHAGGFPPGDPMASFVRSDTVDVWFRARKAPFAFEREALVRATIVGDNGRRNWDMGALRVIESQEWRSLSPTNAFQGPGHAFVASYLFAYWA